MKRLLLISNEIMHYRVSIYNYFYTEFQKYQWDFIIRSNKMQTQNPYKLKFDFKEVDFSFKNYINEINTIKPDIVIVFLHLKDFIMWPLVHWLKLKKIPVVFYISRRHAS